MSRPTIRLASDTLQQHQELKTDRLLLASPADDGHLGVLSYSTSRTEWTASWPSLQQFASQSDDEGQLSVSLSRRLAWSGPGWSTPGTMGLS